MSYISQPKKTPNSKATEYLPRSAEKIDILAQRAAAGQPLFNPNDAEPEDDYLPEEEFVELGRTGKLKRGGPWQPDEDAKLVAMLKVGRTWSEIARELGRTREAVRSRFRYLKPDTK